MNLSQIQGLGSQPNEEIKPRLQAEEARLLRILEAIQAIAQSKEWSSLKTELFDNLVNALERELRVEAREEEPDPKKLNRLAGELKWAERYADLNKLEQAYKVQLQNVRLKLYGKTEEPG